MILEGVAWQSEFRGLLSINIENPIDSVSSVFRHVLSLEVMVLL